MGMGYCYICKKCKKEKEILYGIGFLGYKEFYTDNNFKNLVEIVHESKMKNTADFLRYIKQKGVDIKENYGYDAYICPKCKRVDNYFRFSLFVGNSRFFPKYECRYCGGTLRVKKKNEEIKLKCDYCGSEEFEYSEDNYINWD